MRRSIIVVMSALAPACGTLLGVDDEQAPPVVSPESSVDGVAPEAATIDAPDDRQVPDAADGSVPDAATYRVFVTKATFPGAGGNPDQACAAALGAKFVAWVSTQDLAARNKDIGPGPWYTLDGKLVAVDALEVAQANFLRAAINVDETGAIVAGSDRAWTGSSFTGQVAESCSSWGDAGVGVTGLVNETGDMWRQAGAARDCSELHHFYCFERP